MSAQKADIGADGSLPDDVETLMGDLKATVGVIRHLTYSPETVTDSQWLVVVDRAGYIADRLCGTWEAEWRSNIELREADKAALAEARKKSPRLAPAKSSRRRLTGVCRAPPRPSRWNSARKRCMAQKPSRRRIIRTTSCSVLERITGDRRRGPRSERRSPQRFRRGIRRNG
jgi:hypothetical protein